MNNQEIISGKPLTPTPIQSLALQPVYEGRSVVLQAPTGTGKSLAYLLPLLQRLQEEAFRAPRSGLRLLIMVPTADLQVQICGLAKALVGPGRAETICMIRRDMDNTSVRGVITVATPRHIAELLEDPLTTNVWGQAVAGLDMVVVDEADRLVAKWNNFQRKRRHFEGLVDPCMRVLQRIREETGRIGRKNDWQLVAASATVNRRTQRNLTFSAGIEIELLRAGGMVLPSGTASPMGQYGDGTSSWPTGLQHTMRVVKRFFFNDVMPVLADTILDLGADRLLVAIAAGPERIPKSTFGLNPITSVLRARLEQHKYKVDTCSSAVEAAAQKWVPSPKIKGGSDKVREVVVGTREALRGIHLDDIDAVIVLGDPVSVTEYLHCAGRTCRYQPELGQPVGGHVVSICPENVANRLVKWGALTGYTILEVPLDDPHPSIHVSKEIGGPEGQAATVQPEGGAAEEQPVEAVAPPSIPRIEDDLFAERVADKEDSSLYSAGAWG